MESEILPPDEPGPRDGYKPVALAHRHDGWTADRQRLFLAALAETGCISRACEAAGITARSAYRLRRDPRGAAFAEGWDQALLVATHTLTAHAYERALRGGVREFWRNGQLIGEVRQPSDTLLKFLLQHLAPERFAAPGPFSNRDARIPRAQARLPELLESLADSEVPADALSAADFDPPPIGHPHDRPAPPLDFEDDDYGADYDEDSDDGGDEYDDD